jgi:hypothetical protein
MSDQQEPTFEENFEAAFEPEYEPESEETLEQEPLTEQEPPQTFEFQGRTFTKDQLEPVTKFAAWASENPDRWEKLQKWEAGEIDFGTPVQTAPLYEPEPPIEITEEPDYYSEEYLRGIGEKQRELETQIVRQREAEGQAAVDAGIQSFSQVHQDLSRDDMNQVLKWVHDRQTLLSIPQELPYAQRMEEVSKRFEEGYKVLFYDRIRADETRQVVDDMNKRRRAAASSSSSVSSPRVKPAPNTPEEKRQAYIDDIAQALSEGN